ncbi:replication restart DNA helicase PriA [Desulfomicrobium norvegicum]|uniref:Replication restart protein PriA n=1 Tax=Desulfomicrobium norvegicum (strain DSM 1741 / NCIMB 8310) TaxID=52561 RepID=A0A8G2C4K7_DESNO|nr:primosomal protein N' [Desulfomicrobium norvegicum]SFL99493.1 replication restart DNA helicase PriA [Desulfomicrobium norvegicum]
MREFCSVLLLSSPYSVLTYSMPEDLPRQMWHVGGRVVVPLGKSFRVGILTDAKVAEPEGCVCKDVLWPVDRVPFFSAGYLDFIRDLSIRQMDAAGKILARVLPAALRDLPLFKTREGLAVRLGDLAEGDARAGLARDWMAGRFAPHVCTRRPERLFSLTTEPPWPVRPQATAQLDVLRYLDVHGVSSAKSLNAHFGKNVSQPLSVLLRKELIREVESHFEPDEVCAPAAATFSLTDEQQQAVEGFWELLTDRTPRSALLFGVTGSGKTAVYLELARRCLCLGKHVMLLSPEVGIALKLHRDVREALPEANVRLFHGYLSPSDRQRTFMELADQPAPGIVVGTRSSLFLPIEPGLVILDEEHDASFKQDEGLIYQARELAYGRITRSAGLLLMGSATPDVKVFHAARNGGIALKRLPNRVGEARLPEVTLVDLRVEPPEHGPFATSVRDALIAAVNAGEQVIILHNRRGYAPVLYCETCSEPVKCPHCQVSMTLHKRRELLLCHYCGHSLLFPLSCPGCKGNEFLPLGSGTERLEEFLRDDLPRDTKILRLDRDTSRRAGSMQDTLAAFARQEAQILVGTQMLSKGHHFPGVTLVVVVDGDLGLNLPDYRATERSFQMLVQVAGRAGRGEKNGRVLIQTRNPGHYCWQFVRENDYEGFFTREIALRQVMGYPPFVKLALVRVSLPFDQPDAELMNAFAGRIRAVCPAAGVRVLGPAPAPLAVLRGRKRFQCLLKADSWPAIRGVCAEMRKMLSGEKNVRISVDLDPMDML